MYDKLVLKHSHTDKITYRCSSLLSDTALSEPCFELTLSGLVSPSTVLMVVAGAAALEVTVVFASLASTDGGSCSACFIACKSLFSLGGAGECNLGGRGGGGVRRLIMSNRVVGGGGRGPAVAWRPR